MAAKHFQYGHWFIHRRRPQPEYKWRALNIRPTLDLRTSTIFTDEYIFPEDDQEWMVGWESDSF